MLVKGNYSNGFYGIYSFAVFGLGATAFVYVGAYTATFCSTFWTGLYPSTSCLIILPSGPDPLPISWRFIPFSIASVLAAGLAKTLPPWDVWVVELFYSLTTGYCLVYYVFWVWGWVLDGFPPYNRYYENLDASSFFLTLMPKTSLIFIEVFSLASIFANTPFSVA